MKKALALLLSLCCSVLLSACGSGDKTEKNKQQYSSNSQIQVIPALQMARVQQEQDFPESSAARPAPLQYAQVANNTGIPNTTTVSDATMDGDSGTSLPAMTGPTPAMQPVAMPATPTNTPVPSNPVNSMTSVAPVNAAPVPTSMPAIPQTPVTPPQNSMVQPQNPAIQPQNPVVQQPASIMQSTAVSPQTVSGNVSTSMPTVTAPSSTSMPAPAQNSLPNPSATTVDQGTIERYEALDRNDVNNAATTTVTPPSANSYQAFENVAVPVTFSNSPYNTQLNSYNNAGQSNQSSQATDTNNNTQNTPASAPSGQ